MIQITSTENKAVAQEYMTLREVASLARCHKDTIKNRVKLGQFPKPIRLGGRLLLFRVEEVRAAVS